MFAPGLPHFVVVGLPDAAVQESRERVRAAIRNSGFEFPMRRITVSLAPADIRKEGPSYDLPIAVGILASSGQIDIMLGETVLIGELSLEGTLRHTDGILPMVGVARDRGMRTAVVPQTKVVLHFESRSDFEWPKLGAQSYNLSIGQGFRL